MNIQTLDFSKYQPFSEFIPTSHTVNLSQATPDPGLKEKLQRLEDDLLGEDQMTDCCLSAIWLFNDFIDESHDISQTIHSSEGSYLHGIMHRVEGDFSNAKYWFRKAGGSIANRIKAKLEGFLPGSETLKGHFKSGFDPSEFVDIIQKQPIGSNELPTLAFFELFSVFEYCFERK